MTSFARLRDIFASTAAFWTSLLHGEKSLLHTYLTMTVTGRTFFCFTARLCTRAMTRLAITPAGHTNLCGVTLGSLFKGDLHVVAKICAFINLWTRMTATALTKNISEDITKGIGKSTAAAKSTTTKSATHRWIYTSMTILIISSAFIRIG